MPRWRRPARWPSIATGICRSGRTPRASIRCAPRWPNVLGIAQDTITVRHAHGAGCYGHNGADDVAVDAAVIATADPGPLHPRAVAPRGGVRLRTGRPARCRSRCALRWTMRENPWTGLRSLVADACAAADHRRQHAGARGAADAAARSASERSARGERRRRHAQRHPAVRLSRRSA